MHRTVWQISPLAARTRGGYGALVVAQMLLSTIGATSFATDTPASPDLPQPIYWRQYVFSIPYRVHREPSDPDAPVEVRLRLSTDAGRGWKEISRVRPDVKGFTYFATSDGEYWFSLETVDRHGNTWPIRDRSSMLRVVVDTHPPDLEIKTQVAPSGVIEVAWDSTDPHLVPSSLQIEARADTDEAWRPVNLGESVFVAGSSSAVDLGRTDLHTPDAPSPTDGSFSGRSAWHPPKGTRTVQFRAAVTDRAGNRSETRAQASLAQRPDRVAMLPGADETAGPSARGVVTPVAPSDTNSPLVGTVSQPRARRVANAAGASVVGPLLGPPAIAPDETGRVEEAHGKTATRPGESWPADTTVTTPFGAGLTVTNPYAPPPASPHSMDRAETSVPRPTSGAGGSPRQRVLAPPIFAPPTSSSTPPRGSTGTRGGPHPVQRERPAGNGPTWQTLPQGGLPAPTKPPRRPDAPSPSFSPLDNAFSGPPLTNRAAPTRERQRAMNADRKVQLVNSRSFTLEYQVDSVGPWGVAQVELWGTPDNGATWRRFGVDPDHVSPMPVSVDREGDYGFRIIVQSAGSYGTKPPRPGDRPDVWIRVDLKQPTAAIQSVQKGDGNQADQLTIRWSAADEHLEGNPISLHFASHPAGPWTTIATRLENTGAYAWRVGPHVPEQIYLRLEARDAAGNVGAYSTAEPIALQHPRPTGRIQGVRADRS